MGLSGNAGTSWPGQLLLVDNNQEYAEHVVECHGMFHNNVGKPTMLDVIEETTGDPLANHTSRRLDRGTAVVSDGRRPQRPNPVL